MTTQLDSLTQLAVTYILADRRKERQESRRRALCLGELTGQAEPSARFSEAQEAIIQHTMDTLLRYPTGLTVGELEERYQRVICAIEEAQREQDRVWTQNREVLTWAGL